jgi:DNA-binding NarL/FixJ family response regulator
MAMCPIKIVLVDDHTVMRSGLRMLIEASPGMRVVGEAANRAEAIAAVSATPDLFIVDVDLGEEDGLELIPDLIAALPEIRVLVLTGLRDHQVHRRAVIQGAMGLVLKDRAVETVLKAIEKVCAGEIWFDRSLLANVLRDRIRADEARRESPEVRRLALLTAREREVIGLVGEGLRNRAIADRLAISEATVRHHLTSIFSKLGVCDRTELLVFAYRHHLLPIPS